MDIPQIGSWDTDFGTLPGASHGGNGALKYSPDGWNRTGDWYVRGVDVESKHT